MSEEKSYMNLVGIPSEPVLSADDLDALDSLDPAMVEESTLDAIRFNAQSRQVELTMPDTEIVDWLEEQFRRNIGTGDAHLVMCAVHRGMPLREAVKRRALRVTFDRLSKKLKDVEREQLRHLPLRRVFYPDTPYTETSPEIFVYDEDGNFAGSMWRTGITPPRYPAFAVYGKQPFEIGDPTYVFECGYFWPSREWLQYYHETGRTPGAQICGTHQVVAILP